jgi:hypothetical protein
MTQDEIIEMARQVGLPHWYQTKEVVNIELLERFANLVAQHEGKKYENIITNMAKLLEMQQKREGVAVDMIEAAVLAEREACLKICDRIATEDGFEGGYAYRCVVHIRARGQA